MTGAALRDCLLALICRAEATPTQLRLFVSLLELGRFLVWDGIGIFQKNNARSVRLADRVFEISASANLIAGHPRFSVPIEPKPDNPCKPKPWLVDLLRQASDLRELVWQNREMSLSELAKLKKMGPSTFARILRINYLAPDIQAAIIDGAAPPHLTAWHLMHRAMPLDWRQQRQLLGFEEL
jgi:hypothetical protein